MNRLALNIAILALRFIRRDERAGYADYYVYMHNIREAENSLAEIKRIYFR